MKTQYVFKMKWRYFWKRLWLFVPGLLGVLVHYVLFYLLNLWLYTPSGSPTIQLIYQIIAGTSCVLYLIWYAWKIYDMSRDTVAYANKRFAPSAFSEFFWRGVIFPFFCLMYWLSMPNQRADFWGER